MGIVKINQKLKRLEIQGFEIENQIAFKYFDQLPAAQRNDQFLRAFNIGVLALMEDRLSAFLSRTKNELGTELEHLKLIFDMDQELFYKSSAKGALAENDIAEFLNNFFNEQDFKDQADLTGNTAGEIDKNKTGDIVCRVDGKEELKIVLECKFDKSINLGNIEKKDIFTKKSDTIWSQLIEAQANREGKTSIIVLDSSVINPAVLKIIQNVRFIPEIGFVAIIESQKGNFSNLVIAYMLARDIAINAKQVELNKELLSILINRIIKDLGEILAIKKLVESNIENNKTILAQLEKSMLLMEFNQAYFSKFLADGTLTKKDLLNFYSGDGVNEKFKAIEKEIKEI